MPVKPPYVLHVFEPRVQVVLTAFAVTPVWHPCDSGPGSRIFTSLMKGSDRPGGARDNFTSFHISFQYFFFPRPLQHEKC